MVCSVVAGIVVIVMDCSVVAAEETVVAAAVVAAAVAVAASVVAVALVPGQVNPWIVGQIVVVPSEKKIEASAGYLAVFERIPSEAVAVAVVAAAGDDAVYAVAAVVVVVVAAAVVVAAVSFGIVAAFGGYWEIEKKHGVQRFEL